MGSNTQVALKTKHLELQTSPEVYKRVKATGFIDFTHPTRSGLILVIARVKAAVRCPDVAMAVRVPRSSTPLTSFPLRGQRAAPIGL